MRRSTLGRFLVFSIGLLLIAGALAWWYRDDLLRLAGGETDAAVSPEAAALAEMKLERLRGGGEPARLSAVEVSSLVRYRLSGWVPAPLREPAVDLMGDTMVLAGLLPTEELPDFPELDRVRGFLPDTARVEVAGRLGPLAAGRAAFDVVRVTVSGVPIPARFYPSVLERLGRRDQPGLAPTAVPFVLPEGVGSARVEDGLLVLSP